MTCALKVQSKLASVAALLPELTISIQFVREDGEIVGCAVEQTVEYLGRNLKRAKVYIDVPDANDHVISVFHVDGKKQIAVKKKVDGAYRVDVATLESEHDEPYTFVLPINNNVRILRLADNGKKVLLYRVSVISQSGEFFAVTELTGEYQTYHNIGIIGWQGPDWPSLVEKVLEPMFWFRQRYAKRDFPDINELVFKAEPDASDLAQHEARVLWYCIGDGIGALQLNTGQAARVHWKNVAPRDVVMEFKTGKWHKLAFLSAGLVVRYGDAFKPDRSKRSTAFELEVDGVIVD